MLSQQMTDVGQWLFGATTAAQALESRDLKVQRSTVSRSKCEPSACFWAANLRVLDGDLVVRPGVRRGVRAGSGPPEVRGKPKRNECSLSFQNPMLRPLASPFDPHSVFKLTGRSGAQRCECWRLFPRPRSRSTETRDRPWSPSRQAGHQATARVPQSSQPQWEQ